uniref:Fis family transcriptional regulator, factor for inversion stimulation protein n=1 Tax=Candidatus Kentrum sp. FW TaxID=2126338 RepID=A0A450S1K1_9GAMM|nr:MAG: Fis family transcriptional regulator, factor for inversion stimulation protein [Candidatus Kentron sp. FW]VFJ70787.1 MAG: Fis family transcriptional regulator, factor for inversion stimulation protein [Candidatus Kentron sp. FW]
MTPVEEERWEINNHAPGDDDKPQPLHKCVRSAIEAYFLHLDGHIPSSGLYKMVLDEVEAPLLEVVLQQTRGNYSHAAGLLGINRATLRKKLKQHQITL